MGKSWAWTEYAGSVLILIGGLGLLVILGLSSREKREREEIRVQETAPLGYEVVAPSLPSWGTRSLVKVQDGPVTCYVLTGGYSGAVSCVVQEVEDGRE